jgi:hypothetical protein
LSITVRYVSPVSFESEPGRVPFMPMLIMSREEMLAFLHVTRSQPHGSLRTPVQSPHVAPWVASNSWIQLAQSAAASPVEAPEQSLGTGVGVGNGGGVGDTGEGGGGGGVGEPRHWREPQSHVKSQSV